MEARVPRDDAPDPVLSHQDGSVRVVEEAAPDSLDLPQRLRQQVRVPVRVHQDFETGRGQERSREL